LARLTSPALLAHHLPTLAGANAVIITLGNEGGTIERDDIELGVALVGIVGTLDFGRRPVTTIAAGTRETDQSSPCVTLRPVSRRH